jgi:hypothetical protein
MITMAKVCVEFDANGEPAAPVRVFGITVGNGTSTEFDIPHNFNTQDAFFTVRNTATGEVNEFEYIIDSSDPNNAVIRFTTPPASGRARITVMAPPVVVAPPPAV